MRLAEATIGPRWGTPLPGPTSAAVPLEHPVPWRTTVQTRYLLIASAVVALVIIVAGAVWLVRTLT